MGDNETPAAAGANAVDEGRDLLAGASSVVVLTGAGISTDSGIRDFRGPDGVWTRDPEAEKTATLRYYVDDPEIRRRAWQNRLGSGLWDAEPNDAHRALVRLEDGRLHTLITQNIDGLHHKAGSDPALIVEVHGNVRDVVCLDCEYSAPMAEALDRVRAGEADPDCPSCGGILKSATISFGQSLVPDDLERADTAARECDLMIAIGSTLSVTPICDVVPLAHHHGAAVMIINGQSTQFDDLADVVLRGMIGDVLPALL